MFDDAFLCDPYPTYAALRASGRAVWSPDALGGAWMLPHHDDVSRALRNPLLSSNRSDSFLDMLRPEERGHFAELGSIFSQWLGFLDAPEHTRLRKLLNKGFASRMLERWGDAIRRTAESLADDLPVGQPVDFMAAFAHPFPACVIADLMGVPHADQPRFIRWSGDIVAFFGNPANDAHSAAHAQTSLIALTRYFDAIIAERRTRPGDDLVSLMLQADEDGDRLSADTAAAQCSMLIFGGHETTRNLLGNGLLALLRHPQQLRRLLDDPALVPNAVRELLRYDSPAQYVTRVAREDMDIAGTPIRRGEVVIPLLGSGNRDPTRFERADELDLLRADTAHLSFGQGAHVCIGLKLALLEAEVAFSALLGRFRHISLEDAAPSWARNVAFRGLESLTLRFER